MSLSPDHPDPACLDCRGEGRVSAGTSSPLDQIPCSRCKAREYDAVCPHGGLGGRDARVTQTPGHPCPVCGGTHPHDPCPHGGIARWCEHCAEVGPYRREVERLYGELPGLRAQLAAAERLATEQATKLARQRDALERLRAAARVLAERALHAPDCPAVWTPPRGDCTCGLAAALAESAAR